MANVKTVNKDEYVKRVAERTGLTQKDVKAVIEAEPQVIEDAIINGEKVDVRGCFTAEGKDIKAGVDRNPKTKEDVPRHAHKRASMKISPMVRKRVKEVTTIK